MPEKKHWGCVKKNCGFTFSIRRHGCMACAYSRILKPESTESPAPSGQAELVGCDTCAWEFDDNTFADNGLWETTCGETWYLPEGSPKENGMEFCPMCGKPLTEK